MAKKIRKKINFFPHFSLKKPAKILRESGRNLLPILKQGLKSLILLLLLALFLLNLHTNFFPQNEEFYKKKMAVLKNPENPNLHAKLALFFLKNGDFKKAERELSLANNLSSSKDSPILGAARVNLENLKEAPERIREEIKFWKKVIEEKKDYRDAYLQLAVLNYQIHQVKQAKKYLQKALQIDPNFEQARNLEKLLSGE